MNQVILVGRLVRDVEIKAAGNQHQVSNNVLAINRRTRNKNGEPMTDFIPIVAWDSLAEILSKYCQKGQRIAIHGKLQSRSYTANDQQRYVIECVLQEITLLDRPQQNNNLTPPSEIESNESNLTFEFEPVE